jgi:hypothetical protein
MGIGDSGCTGHYLAVRDRNNLDDIKPCTTANTIKVRMPNGALSRSTHTGYLRLPQLPRNACLAYLFEDQQAQPLISLGVLCDHGMVCTLDAERLVLEKDKQPVMHGWRNHATGMWEIDISARNETQQPVAANVIRNRTDYERMAYYHAMFFSPTMSTFQAAADAGLLDFLPGFTAEKLRKNPIHTMATAKGHLDRTRKGQNSTHRTETRAQKQRREASEEHDTFPRSIETQSEQLYVHMSPLHNYTEHMDATGKFMVQSRANNWYILIIFNEDANYVHFEVLKSRSAESYRAASFLC